MLCLIEAGEILNMWIDSYPLCYVLVHTDDAYVANFPPVVLAKAPFKFLCEPN